MTHPPVPPPPPPPPDRLGERGVVLLLVGIAAFGWPCVAVFDEGTFLGMPTLYAWLFGAWAALVVGLALAAERG